jgi:hypothetical protein
LFDVTTCAMGAYPQTDAALAVRSLTKKRSSGVVIPSVWSMAAGATTANATETKSLVVPAEAESNVAPEAVGEAQEPVAEEPAAHEPPQKIEDKEAQEREFKLWQQKRLAEHRRTREFAFGVLPLERKESEERD